MRSLLAVVLVILGCSPKAPVQEGRAEVGPTKCSSGTIGAAGSEGFEEVILRTESDGTLILLGAEELRLARLLTGGEVEVCGSLSQPEGLRSVLEIERVRLLRMDGMEAHLGLLATSDLGWVLRENLPNAQESVPLASVPSGLIAAAESLVWVAGEWRDGTFHVASFGILPP